MIGLAVSGGSDSMAMLHLMARTRWPVRAVTVDHALRAGAADEARFVGRVCADLAVQHDILQWDHGVIAGNLMDAARHARYDLIATWARSHDIAQVALAHTATDQAETFVMGLARTAGLDGLSGMRAQFTHGDVVLRRPFLMQTRADLRGYLVRHGLAWVDDPTNDIDHYTRTKARRALRALAPLGITEQRLSGTVQHLAMAQGALRRATQEAALQLTAERAGALRIERAAFRDLDPELARRVVILGLMWLGGAAYPPRAAGIQRLLCAIATGTDATLAGCRLRTRADKVWLVREARALGGAVAPDQLWDGRWRVDGPGGEGHAVRALGAAGLSALKDWRAQQLPRDVLLATPGVWHEDRLIAAPWAQKSDVWSATVSQSFNEFIKSH